MPKKIGNVGRDILVNAALPAATATYTVISHQYVIDTIEQALADNGFTVSEEVYRCTTDAKVAHGAFHIEYDGDPDLGLMYTFSNSYDKSLRFKAAIGAHVYANGGYMLSNIDNWKRKHTGTADNETETLINDHITNAHTYFDQLKADKDSMQEIEIDKITFGGMIGQMFMLGYLTIDQLSLIQKEYENSSFPYTTGKDNLWTCYSHIINALKQSHPSKWMSAQGAVHLFVVTKFNLTQFDEEEATDEIQIDSTESSQEINTTEIPTEAEETVFIPKGVAPNDGVNPTEIGSVFNINGVEHEIIAQQDIDDAPHWEMKLTKTQVEDIKNVVEPILTGIHDGVEVVPTLPGFEPEMGVEPEVEEEVVDPAQISLENQIEQANAAQPVDLDAEEDADWEKHGMKEVGADAEMQEMKTEEVIAEREVEDTPTEPMPTDEFRFPCEDYDDKQIGDVIELNGSYYEVGDVETTEDTSYWLCKALEIEESGDTEVLTAEDLLEQHQEVLTNAQVDAITEKPAAVIEAIETFDPTPEQDPEEMLFEKEDVAGDLLIAPGAFIEVDDVFYTVIREEDINGTLYLACKKADVSEEDPFTEGPVEAALPVQEPVEAAQVEAPVENVSDEFDISDTPTAQEDPLVEEVLEVVEEVVEEKLDPVKAIISQEIEDIYGDDTGFTYTTGDGLYHIKRESGETFVLSQSYIDGLLTEI